MALPQIKAPIRKLKLSNDKVINYRPFTVKEEKILLLAKEEGNSTRYNAVLQIINNCTFGKLDLDSLKTIDIEKLFINIRSDSIGNVVTLSFICKAVHEEKECGKHINIAVDLDETKYPALDKDLNLEFNLGDGVTINLKEPVLETLIKQEENSKESYSDIIFYLDKIVQGDEVFECDEYSLDELELFTESISLADKILIAKTIDKFPKANQTVKYKCKCGNTGEYNIRGIQNFFM